MEIKAVFAQLKSDPRAIAPNHFTANMEQQGFYVIPNKIPGNRVFKNSAQRFAVFAVHEDNDIRF
jgi:hypothetical protein